MAEPNESEIVSEMEDTIGGMLINLVHGEPRIWDLKNPIYSKTRTKQKDALWKVIADQLNMTVEKAKAVWKNARTVHRREIKKCIPKSSGDEGGELVEDVLYTGIWKLFDKMRFMMNVMVPRKVSGNLPQKESEADPTAKTAQAGPVSEAGTSANTTGTSANTTQSNEFHPNNQPRSTPLMDINTGMDDYEVDLDDEPISAETPKGTGGASSKKRTSVQRALDLQAKKLKLYQMKEENRSLENDQDWLFLKSLHPSVLKIKDKFNFRMQAMTLVKDLLDQEALDELM